MSQLIVLTFGDTEQAGEAFEALRKVQSQGNLNIDDAAVIVKDESGKVHVKNQMDSGMKWGAVGGGALGLLLAGVFFPLAGIAIGAIGGALLGKLAHKGVDQSFVKDVTEELKPGNSALFLMVSGANPDMAIGALRSFEGKVYQTTLPTEVDEALQDALSGKE